jgi:hypothetical protein
MFGDETLVGYYTIVLDSDEHNPRKIRKPHSYNGYLELAALNNSEGYLLKSNVGGRIDACVVAVQIGDGWMK